MAVTPVTTATTSTFWGKCKNFSNFLIGDWAKGAGIEYHALKKGENPISIFDAYHRYFNNTLTNDKAIKAAGQAERLAKAAGQTVAGKGFWKSIGGFLSKYAGPVMMWLGPIINVVSEIKNGGNLIGIAKEFTKGVCGMAGWTGGTLLATAVFGLTPGGWAGFGIFAIGILGGMAADFLAKAILGESTGEKLARQKEEQQNNPFMQNNPFGQQQGYANLYQQQNNRQFAGNNFGGYCRYRQPNIGETMQKVEASFKAAENIFMNRNNGSCLI